MQTVIKTVRQYTSDPDQRDWDDYACTGVSTRLHCTRVEEDLMNYETVDLLIYSLLDTYVVGGEKRSVLIILILT